jgi:hypothetical protein
VTRRHLLASAFAAPAFVRAQTIEERGRKIMQDCLAALGGPAFLAMKDRIETGRAYSYYRERLSGLGPAKIESFYDDSAPGLKLREKQSYGKKFDYYVLFEGNDKAWDVNFRGAKPVPELLVRRWQDSLRRNLMYILRYRMNEPGIIFERKASEVFDNVPVELVDVIDSDNRQTTMYIHASTKLPIRQYYRRQSPVDKGWDEEDTRYAKYRAASGVMWPWAITKSRNGERVYEIYSDTVTINTGLNLSDFQIANGVTILPSKEK